MLQQEIADDYVIATGITHSVSEFFFKVFDLTGLKGHALDYYEFDPRQKRPSEVDLLVGDGTKAKTKLGWTPKVNFESLVEKMYINDLNIERNRV